MANEKSQNVQDVFLNHVRKNKTPVTVFLVNGVKLQGIITWFDNFSVLLRRDGHTQLVYKHAISTVMPGAPIQLFDATKAEGAARRRHGRWLLPQATDDGDAACADEWRRAPRRRGQRSSCRGTRGPDHEQGEPGAQALRRSSASPRRSD